MFYWFSFALFWLKVGLNFFSQLAIIQKENNTGLVSQVPSCSRLGQSGTVPERDSPRTPTLYPRLKFLTKIVKRRRGRHTQTKSRTLKTWKWHYSTIFVYSAMSSDRTVLCLVSTVSWLQTFPGVGHLPSYFHPLLGVFSCFSVPAPWNLLVHYLYGHVAANVVFLKLNFFPVSCVSHF